MKKLTIQNEGAVSDTIFLNGESILETIQCAFDSERICSPNCAACEVSCGPIKSGYPHVDFARCSRGDFVIGTL
jgi:hypothetical protein